MNSPSRSNLQVGEFYFNTSLGYNSQGVLYLVARTDSDKPIVLILDGPYNFRMFDEVEYVQLPAIQQYKLEEFFLQHRKGKTNTFNCYDYYYEYNPSKTLIIANINKVSIDAIPIKTLAHLKSLLDTNFNLMPHQKERIIHLFNIIHQDLFQALPPASHPL